MKQGFIIISYTAICIFLAFPSCTSNKQKLYLNNGLVKTDSCQLSPSITYEIYTPNAEANCSNLPLLIVIDPQGNSKFAVEKFKYAASRFKCIVLSSSSIKNGNRDFVTILNTMIDDVRSKYVDGKVILLAGFSGGARMALNYAQYFPVKGIISCGALATHEQLNAIKAPVICLIGMADFNFIEAAQYVFNPEQSPQNLSLEFTKDTHAWPDSEMLSNALGMMLLNLSLNQNCETIKDHIKSYKKTQVNRYDSLMEMNYVIEAVLIARNMAKNGSKIFTNRLNTIENSYDFNYALDQLRESIRFELAVRNAYYTALRNEDIQWWEKEIRSLNQNIDNEKDIYRSFALKRIKGFLGITCYSLSNNSIRNNDLKTAERILAIYRLIDPENPDMHYFSALYELKNKHPELVRDILRRAIQEGFSDTTLMKSDFPHAIIAPLLELK